MIFGEHRFVLRWGPSLLLALPIPLFVYLGLWQMDRAEEKRLQAETLSQRAQQAPLRLSELYASAESLRFRKVIARGRFETAQQFFIENRRHGGRTGFHVITPLRLQNSAVHVLVNRGWLAANADMALPLAAAPEGIVEVRGEITIPSPPALALHKGADAGSAWGKRWPYMTVELFAATVDYALEPFVILQDPQDAGGFVRQWPIEMPKEGMHLGYAIQWFAFALISLGFYLRLSLVRDKRREQHA